MVSELKNYFHNKLINLEANNTRISLLVLGKERALDPRARTKTSLIFEKGEVWYFDFRSLHLLL